MNMTNGEEAADHRPPNHHRITVCVLDPVHDFVGFRAGEGDVRLERISDCGQMVIEFLRNQLSGPALTSATPSSNSLSSTRMRSLICSVLLTKKDGSKQQWQALDHRRRYKYRTSIRVPR